MFIGFRIQVGERLHLEGSKQNAPFSPLCPEIGYEFCTREIAPFAPLPFNATFGAYFCMMHKDYLFKNQLIEMQALCKEAGKGLDIF